MLFENCRTKTDQGNVGESRAIYELTKLGYGLYKPLYHNVKADFIAEKDGKLYKVQVKTSSVDRKSHDSGFPVHISTSGGNTKINTIRKREYEDYDLLFILHKTGRCWLIPATELGDAGTAITVGGLKYKDFEIDTDLVVYPEINRPERNTSPNKRSRIDTISDDVIRAAFIENNGDLSKTIRSLGFKYVSPFQRNVVRELTKDIEIPEKQECKYFTKEELERLMKEMPVYKIGQKYGISDNAVHRWVKKWGLK